MREGSLSAQSWCKCYDTRWNNSIKCFHVGVVLWMVIRRHIGFKSKH